MKKQILIFLLSLCFLLPLLSTINKSAVWDEPRHFYTGLRYLLNTPLPGGVLSSLSPPLEAINILPSLLIARFLKINFIKDINYFYDYIFCSRIVTAIYSLILGLFVYRWSRQLYAKNAGLFALTLYTFCPNILAHAGVMTTDLAFSCFSFIWFYYFWRSQDSHSYRDIFLSALFFSLALISKFNFLMFIPIYLFMGFLLWLASGSQRKIFLRRFILSSLIVFLIGLFILNASYRFSFVRLQEIFRYFPRLSRLGIPGNIILSIPYGYLNEIKCVLKETLYTGHPAFLMGRYSQKGWPYYYLIAFLIKTPIPVIIFLIIAIYTKIKNSLPEFKTREYFLWVPAVSIFVLASLQHSHIGIRHILPVYPFMFVFISRIINLSYLKNKIFRGFSIVLLTWLIISCAWVFPHYLAYFNELIAGPGQGYKYLVDSNLDWGQDLAGLKKYMDKNKVRKIKLSYFGFVKPEYYGIDYQDLPQVPTEGLVAISATNLQGAYFDDHTRYHWLKKYRPKAKIGYSIFVYDIK